MAGKFTFTYKGLSDIGPTTNRGARAAGAANDFSSGPIPAVVPVLKSFDLFPTRIWQAHLPSFAPQLESWVKVVLAMRAANPKPAGRTARQGWNSEDMAVLERPDFARLKQVIGAACASALGEMGAKKAKDAIAA